ncbi:MAG: HAD family hydrolase [Acidobacteria bacterium]|nr:HAD family hydrolase [Acidobacteriota bacterium]MDA1233489.1 HAD family hydrolase [Acidobacteriota bacterium]
MRPVVFFDLDETLVAQEQAFERAYNAAARFAAEHAQIDEIEFASSLPTLAQEVCDRAPFAELLRRCRFGGRDVLWCDEIGDSVVEREIARSAASFRADVWTIALGRHGVTDERIVNEVGAAFSEAMSEALMLFPEVESAIVRLSKRSRMAVITNGMTAPQFSKLRRLGIEQHFERLVASAAVGAGKPSREIFDHALREMAVSPSDAVMIGDSLEGDIAGAKRVGIRTIWINRSGRPLVGPVQPDAELADLSSLADFMAAGFEG